MFNVDREIEFMFKTLGSRSRLRLLKILLEKGEMNVTEISTLLNSSYKGISRNLNLLYQAGFLNIKHVVNYTYYSIRHHQIENRNLTLIALLKSEFKKEDNHKKVDGAKLAKYITAAMFEPRLKRLLEIIDE